MYQLDAIVHISPFFYVNMQESACRMHANTPKDIACFHRRSAHKLKDMQFVFWVLRISVSFIAFRHVNCSMQMVTACHYISQPETLCFLTKLRGGIWEALDLMNGTSLETDLEIRFCSFWNKNSHPFPNLLLKKGVNNILTSHHVTIGAFRILQ